MPAYISDGIVLARVFQGSTDVIVFADFIGQLLYYYGRWPEPKSVLVMDNASFHRWDAVEKLCTEAGVKLLYLPPYSPDLNPTYDRFVRELPITSTAPESPSYISCSSILAIRLGGMFFDSVWYFSRRKKSS